MRKARIFRTTCVVDGAENGIVTRRFHAAVAFGPDGVHRGFDEVEVAKALREVPKVPVVAWIDFFCKKSNIIGPSEFPLEEVACVVHAVAHCRAGDQGGRIGVADDRIVGDRPIPLGTALSPYGATGWQRISRGRGVD